MLLSRCWDISRERPTDNLVCPKSFQELWLGDLVNKIQLTPIINSNLVGKSKKVWVIRSSKQISNKKGRESKYHEHFHGDGHWIWTGVTRKVKTRNWHSCFEINSLFWTSVQCYTVYFSDMLFVQNLFRVIKGKIMYHSTWKKEDITIFPAYLARISGLLFPVCVMNTWILLQVSKKFLPLWGWDMKVK